MLDDDLAGFAPGGGASETLARPWCRGGQSGNRCEVVAERRSVRRPSAVMEVHGRGGEPVEFNCVDRG